jgi:hypothetical protein
MRSISVAQPLQIQLQRLGNIVVVYFFFADFVNGAEGMTPLFCDFDAPWHFKAKISMYINFA